MRNLITVVLLLLPVVGGEFLVLLFSFFKELKEKMCGLGFDGETTLWPVA